MTRYNIIGGAWKGYDCTSVDDRVVHGTRLVNVPAHAARTRYIPLEFLREIGDADTRTEWDKATDAIDRSRDRA